MVTMSPKKLELANRIVLQYVEQGDPAGLPLVLLHGYMDSWRAFEPLLPYLPPHLHVFAVTQRGHGEASRPAQGYSTRDFAADVELFLDALGLGAAVLVGGSSGGFAARRFALDHPNRTLGLVLLGSPATLHDKAAVLELWETEISKLSDPPDPDFVRAFQVSTTRTSVPTTFLDTVVGESMRIPARIWKAVFKGLLEDKSIQELNKIAGSTLLVWGEEDSIVPREDQNMLASAIEMCKLVVIPDTGHALYWEKPERVARELTDFARDLAYVER